jgi:hypothetical protein
MDIRFLSPLLAKVKQALVGFFGLKLHLLINDLGAIMNFQWTTGKVNDRLPVENLCEDLMGKVFPDKE